MRSRSAGTAEFTTRGRGQRIVFVALNQMILMAHRLAYAGRFTVGAMLGGLAWLGCASTPLGATQADLTRGRDQFMQGATVFSNECATCHGARGEGLASAPPI